MLKTTLAAAFIAAGFALPAQAIPASSPAPSISEAGLQPIQVRDGRDRHSNRHSNRHRGHKQRHHSNRGHWHGRSHWNGRDVRVHRYHGWRRYSARPWNWQARGCVVVGPVWFCP